jgi:hypothetical protein
VGQRLRRVHASCMGDRQARAHEAPNRRNLRRRVANLLQADRLLGLECPVDALRRDDLLTLVVEDERRVLVSGVGAFETDARC